MPCTQKIRQKTLLQWFSFAVIGFILLSTPVSALPASSDDPDDRPGTSHGFQPLQKMFKVRRPPGPVLVAIPVSYEMGLGKLNQALRNYCSPSIRINNSSNREIEEVIVGISYWQKPERHVGETITRFTNIQINKQDTHFFYQLETNHCWEIRGEVQVIRCMYVGGEPCVKDVQASAYGAIPLKLKSSDQGRKE